MAPDGACPDGRRAHVGSADAMEIGRAGAGEAFEGFTRQDRNAFPFTDFGVAAVAASGVAEVDTGTV